MSFFLQFTIEKAKTKDLFPLLSEDPSGDRDPKEVDRILSDILTSYKSDFGKHAPVEDVPKIRYIWQSLPSQLARENKKLLYSVVRPGARAREYENALNWLRDADIVSKVHRLSKPGLPC